MMRSTQRQQRRGGMVPLVALSMIGMLGFVALAIDVGVMALAKNRCQNVADLTAMAGARQLNGDVANDNNYSNAYSTAVSAATKNSIIQTPIDKSQVTVNIGAYSYDYTGKKFVTYPNSKPTGENWTLVQATVGAGKQSTFFASLVGVGEFNTQATAAAAHRPRDVVVIGDLSGSMRFDSNLGMSYYGSRSQAMNPETVYPQFGHYYNNSSWLTYDAPYPVSGGEVAGAANITVETNAGPAIVEDFYKDTTRYGTSEKAFTAAPDSYATTPDGDNYKPKKGKSIPNYAVTVKDITGGTSRNGTWETSGYGATFKGYTLGPRYWGKTFFIWPPDPRSTWDWRRKFFTYGSGVTNYNQRLWDSNGQWQAPSSGTYTINYTAILNWLKNTGTNPFPTRLQAGGILYYDSIPSSITSGSGGSAPSDQNQRFWKEYIDYVLGVRDNYDGTYTAIIDDDYTITSQTGYGGDQQWGTVKISSKPSNQYMNYEDNPLRPVTRTWFGPLTMVDFLGNYNQNRFWWPGTCREAPTYQLKLGFQAALNDIKINHPNDNVALIYFSTPADDEGNSGSHNTARVPLGRDYKRLVNSLWFAPQSIDDSSRDIRPYDKDGAIHDVPRGKGGTCYAMPLYLAYNQFSSNRTDQLYTYHTTPGLAGGNGRAGSQKLLIFETDGMVNTTASAKFTDAGKWNSYYNVRIGSKNEYPSDVGGSGDSAQQAYDAAERICALETDAKLGYSTTRKPVLIHCIAFGALFESSNTSTKKDDALERLQMLQYIGGKANGEQPDPTTPLASYKVIVGPMKDRIANLQKAFSAIMQDGVQVSLVQ